jgi:hypothetical protein
MPWSSYFFYRLLLVSGCGKLMMNITSQQLVVGLGGHLTPIDKANVGAPTTLVTEMDCCARDYFKANLCSCQVFQGGLSSFR